MRLLLLPDLFTLYQFSADVAIPQFVLKAPFYFISRTPDELSILAPQHIVLESQKCEKDWRAFKVDAVMDFSLVGILAKLSHILAAAHIPLYAISTWNTDYLFVKDMYVENAIQAFVTHEIEVQKHDG